MRTNAVIVDAVRTPLAKGKPGGAYDIVIASGVESMSRVPIGSQTLGQDFAGPKVRARYENGLVPRASSSSRGAGTSRAHSSTSSPPRSSPACDRRSAATSEEAVRSPSAIRSAARVRA